nr:7928_t:CDS:2 [Entrophospora candida]
MAMGFDLFSSILCLYGGSITGLMGMISSERMKSYFGRVSGNIEGKEKRKPIFAQVPLVGKILNSKKIAENTPEYVTNHYEEGEKNKDLGRLEAMEVAEAKPKKKKN